MANDFTGAKISFDKGFEGVAQYVDVDTGEFKPPNIRDGTAAEATKWKRRRPICPYGCGEEGQLVEIVMVDGRAIGVYKDSDQLVFTAPMKMNPNPDARKLVIGPDGEPQLSEGENT